MKIAVLGTGNVGKTIGNRLIELGHNVCMGSRTADNAKAIEFAAIKPEQTTNGTYADAAQFGELIFNCTSGMGSINALELAGDDNLKGKILIDVSNPLDASQGFPPSLSICNTNSLGEEIQSRFPDLKVVKTLNTMWCGLMVNPQMINQGDHQVFMSGNDSEAKQKVSEVLKSFGWPEASILDLGDITTARGTEMWLPLWLRIYGAKKSGAFNIKIIS